ncbi:MAG: DNA repair protein RadA [Deltaproteobacteria bacterium]|nr:DNA repair protein RadA [Deltaproteobacteria bacterium]
MARAKVVWRCASCGHSQSKWAGRCPQCGEWNSLEEGAEQVAAPPSATRSAPVALSDVPLESGGEVRMRTGIQELDTPLGGGVVAGSLVLLGGDPGIGKSTLLLMALDRFARRGLPALYVTGEESAAQVRLRAERLGMIGSSMLVLAETDFEAVDAVVRAQRPVVAVVDSVQTLSLPGVGSAPGSVAQVREVAHRAMLLAKSTGTAIFLVGHINKSGEIAGPKVLEHLVDAVLNFEGDGSSTLRILRAGKNRFGASGELGVFEMGDTGLIEVPDASARLLQERVKGAAGTVVVAAMEGTRPLLAEVQALVGRPGPQTPGRTCVGVDRQRVIMLAAVLEKAGLTLYDRDIFVNAVGGVRLDEPSADLGIAVAIASSLLDRPLPPDLLVFGELGLVGEVRGVSRPEARLREAARHGFTRVIAPHSAGRACPPGLELIGVHSIGEVIAHLGGPEQRRR